MVEIIDFVMQAALPAFLGLFGGGIHVLVMKYGWKEKANVLRELLLSASSAVLYSLTGLPDSLALIAVGYAGTDFAESLLTKIKPRV